MVTCCKQRIYSPHTCGVIIEERALKTSFSDSFWVDYCPKCEIYSYRWGVEDKVGVNSGDEQEVIKYIEDSQKIIRQKHLENISER